MLHYLHEPKTIMQINVICKWGAYKFCEIFCWCLYMYMVGWKQNGSIEWRKWNGSMCYWIKKQI